MYSYEWTDEWINIKYLKKLGYNTDKMTSFQINDLKEELSSKMKKAHLESFFGDYEDCLL